MPRKKTVDVTETLDTEQSTTATTKRSRTSKTKSKQEEQSLVSDESVKTTTRKRAAKSSSKSTGKTNETTTETVASAPEASSPAEETQTSETQAETKPKKRTRKSAKSSKETAETAEQVTVSSESQEATPEEPEKPASKTRRSTKTKAKSKAKTEKETPVVEAQLQEEPAEESLVPETEEFAITFRPKASTTPNTQNKQSKAGSQAENKAKKATPEPVAEPEVITSDDNVLEEAEEFGISIAFRSKGESQKPSRNKDSRKQTASTAAKVEQSKQEQPDQSEELVALLEETEISIDLWRAPATRKGKERQEAKPAQEKPSKKDKKRKKKLFEEVESPVETVAQPQPQPEPEPPKPVSKPILPVPEDAPQVVMRNGQPTIVRNGTVYPPIMFFGATLDEQRANNVFEEIRMAGRAGVHLHGLFVDFIVDPAHLDKTVNFAAWVLNKAVEADPEAQVLFRVVFGAPNNWEEKYPNARYQTLDGEVAPPSVSDDEFWSVARECLKTFVQRLRKLPNNGHILGLQLERGEWFLPQGQGYDISKAAKIKFRDWAKARYRNDVVALRAAWFNSTADFDKLTIPPFPKDEELAPDKFVRANRKERQWVDYHLFLSDQTEDRIADLAYAAKEESEGYFMIGVSYGYTFEWSHPASGHLSLGKMLRNPDVDFIAGPPSYRNREPGGAASFPGPIDSFALNGKVYISEEDFKTSIGTGYQPDDFNPTIKTPQALESMHWRGVGAALTHNSAVSWMDLWGNGWLKTPSVWERAAVVRDALIRRMSVEPAAPDVAIFIDERALAYLVDQKGFSLLVQNVRESVMRAGLSSAFYLLSDLQHRENFPESRLYVFLNAWDVRTELRAAIKSRLQRDGKVLFWLYTAGLFDSGRESLERAREITGIALRPQPFHSRTGTTILNRRHSLCEAFPEKTSIGGARLEPSYFAIPEDGTVLGEYSQTGLPSFVLREFEPGDPVNGWKSVFLGEPIVNAAMIRALADIAGCHTWSFNDDVVHVRPPFLTVHCSGVGQRTIALPDKWSAYDLIEQQWVGYDATSLKFHATDGSTHCFLVGKKQEIEQILNLDPSSLLHMDELPPRTENTARFDSFNFDVPIMRIDEWMEGTDDEELTDDLLFKPLVIEEDFDAAPEPERIGKRRRNRKGKDRDRRRNGQGSERVNVDDLSMNVMFRKRD